MLDDKLSTSVLEEGSLTKGVQKLLERCERNLLTIPPIVQR